MALLRAIDLRARLEDPAQPPNAPSRFTLPVSPRNAGIPACRIADFSLLDLLPSNPIPTRQKSNPYGTHHSSPITP